MGIVGVISVADPEELRFMEKEGGQRFLSGTGCAESRL